MARIANKDALPEDKVRSGVVVRTICGDINKVTVVDIFSTRPLSFTRRRVIMPYMLPSVVSYHLHVA